MPTPPRVRPRSARAAQEGPLAGTEFLAFPSLANLLPCFQEPQDVGDVRGGTGT